MELSDLVKQYGSQAALAEAVGVDRAQLNRVVRGHRPLGHKLAVAIFTRTGIKLGPLAARP